MKKIGITGSLEYQDRRRLIKLISRLHDKYKDNLAIVTGGNKYGVDKIVKEITKRDFGIKYIEFPPLFKRWNHNCTENGVERYKYNQDYNSKYYYIRYYQMINFVDSLIVVSNNKNEVNTNTILKSCEKADVDYILTS